MARRIKHDRRTDVSTPPEPVPIAPPADARPWRPYLALGLMVCVFFWDSILAGQAFVMRDTMADFMPWRLFGREAFGAGALPLWNPYSHCGQPFIANPQTAFFYPPHLMFYLLPPVFALKLWWIFHFLVAGWSMCALARHWRLSVPASLLAAVGFAFGSYFIQAMEFQSLLGTIAWTPLSLLLTSRLLEAWRGRRSSDGLKTLIARLIPNTLGLAMVLATQFLSGHQQSFIQCAIIDGLYLLFACLWRLDWKGLAVCGTACATAGGLALGLCMIQFLLTWQLIPLSVRAASFDPSYAQASFHPQLLLNFLMPFLAGRPGYSGQWWGDLGLTTFEFWAGTAYIGLAPLILATIGLARFNPRCGRHVFLAVTVGLGLLMAMGSHTPLYPWCYNHLPIIDKFRWPAKFLHLVAFALPAAAAFGFEALREAAPARNRLVVAILSGWTILWSAMLIAWLTQRNSPDFFEWLTNGVFIADPGRPQDLAGLGQDLGWAVLFLGLSLSVLWAAAAARNLRAGRIAEIAVPIVAFANLYAIGRQIQPILDDEIYAMQSTRLAALTSDADPGRFTVRVDNQGILYGVNNPDIYAYARDTGVGESSLPLHLFKIHGGETLHLARYMKFLDKLASLPEGSPRHKRTANLLNLRRYIMNRPILDIVNISADQNVRVARIDDSVPRAMIVTAWTTRPFSEESIDFLLDPQFDIYRSIVVDCAPDGWPAEQPLPPDSPHDPITTLAEAGVDKIEYGWNRVDITARSDGRAMLFLDDVDYPGWVATVDGKPVPILTADLFFRAVPLETAGVHRVAFEYKPPPVRIGFAVSVVTILLMAMLAVFAWRTRPIQ